MEKSSCRICQEDLPENNLQIREHINDVHNIAEIIYRCKLCTKNYNTISSIKSHYPACKRKIGTNIPPNNTIRNIASQVAPPPTPAPTTTNTNNNIAFQCKECQKGNVTFVAKDNKGLVTHMRTKHVQAYEESKKVANIRIAWSNDEDRILASLELQLKAVHKGQILERLTTEWQKLVQESRANVRSKEAIRGRRQQTEYKRTLEELSNTPNGQPTPTTRSPQGQTTTTDNASSVNVDSESIGEIKEALKTYLTAGHTNLTDHMKDAINGFIDNTNSVDPVQLTMSGIMESITTMRNRVGARNQRIPNIPKKTTRNQTRKRKAEMRAYYQKLYAHNKSRLMDEIIEGVAPNTEPPPIHETVKFYENIWSVRAEDNHAVSKKTGIAGDNRTLLSPITKPEILTAISKTKRDSAKGIDTITLHEAKQLANDDLFVAFNIWLGCKSIPAALKLNRTTLIPKGNQNLDKVTNWRPITISSILLRLFNKIMAGRMSKFFQMDKRQLGFTPINGCSMNIAWLNLLLKHARLNKKEINVCLIDVAKAFDSVPHDSIFRALRRHNAPPHLIELIQQQYEDSSTTITYQNLSSKKIKILRGVKQGDALSPLLFNLVTDELFQILGDRFGYTIDNIGSTNIRCFADDMCLVSGTKVGMGNMIRESTQFLNERGLQINPNKCMTIALEKGYKGKKSKIVIEPVFTIQGAPVPILGHTTNTTKYLGVKFTSVGSIKATVIKEQLISVLEKLQKVSLKPFQKIDLLRSHVIPLFVYQLINLELYPKLVKQIDLIIRRTIRSILHLPTSLSNEFFYLSVREGGLGFPVLRNSIGLAKVRIYKSIMRSEDEFLKHLIETHGFPIIRRFLDDLQVSSSFENDDLAQRKRELKIERNNSFAQKVHGYGSEIFAKCPLTNSWLHAGYKTLTGRNYINGIKLRTNTFETKVTTNRGLAVDKTCRRCHKENESLMHVIQFCNNTKGLRYRRHNQICSRICQKLRERGFDVFSEKAFTTDVTGLPNLLRPDIIAKKDGKAIIIDVQCVYESTTGSFTNAANSKIQKYTPLIEAVKNQLNCTEVEVTAMIVGSRGSFHRGHLHQWYQMGFSTTELKYLALNCMENSIRILLSFNRGCQGSTDNP